MRRPASSAPYEAATNRPSARPAPPSAALPRLERRALELQLLRRPALSENEAARKLRVSPATVSDAFDRGLERLARALGGRRSAGSDPTVHLARETLVTYVAGALSGDEARDVTTHAGTCTRCGDRLGVLMLLKAGASESARTPWLSRGQRRLVVAAFAAVAIAASALVADALWPNPWAAHATEESVPEWFYGFFYGEGRDDATGPTARGLALLVSGALPEAIETLEPEAAGGGTEAAAYLGIARYLSGERTRATVRLLERGTESIRAGRLSRWYLASALLTRRDPEGAKRQLEALATTQDWFGRRASELLEKLESPEVEPGGVAA